jgi:N4-gp56 family major capsid protein
MNLYLCYANDNDALIPELWAQESLAILEENMVMANLVHRDFSPLVASYGDVVNTRRPSEFSTKRKAQSDSVVNQDATSTNVQVPLDQHVYVTFTIKDEEASLSFKELVSYYMEPAAMQMARTVDRILCGQVPQFATNAVGRLSEMSSANAKDWILDVREKMNINKAYPNGRNLVISPQAETEMLKTELFISAEKRGDGGTALEEARLGRVLGFDTYMDQNVNYRALSGGDTLTLNHTAGASAGDTGNKACTASSAATVGAFVWFTGEGQPHEVKAITGTLTGITLVDEYKYDVSANAVGYAWEPAVVGATYAAKYDKGITLNTIASALLPLVGQLLAFGTDAGGDRKIYTIIEVDSVSATSVIVWLDRPLEVGVTAADLAFPGPQGSMCFAFHRDALALVSRPLALPASALGVQAAVGSYNNLAMRVAMQYNISSQGTVVTLDMLCGVKTLDTNLGCVLYA